LNDLQAKFQELHTELDAFKERVFTDVASQWDENEVPETVEDRQNKQSQEDFIKQIQFNFSELQNENDELLNEVSELKEKLTGLEDLKRKYETLKHELEESEVQQKVVDGLESETKAELQTIQQNQDDFIKQIQFNFNELQNENDELLNEVSELKERLAGLEAIRSKYEALNQELEENKKQLSSVEQNNAKLKAKLKQYVKQKKQTEPEKGKFFEDVNSVKRSPNKMCS
jgi:chromosome segregation ATPase